MKKTTKIISLTFVIAGLVGVAWLAYPAATQWVSAQTTATKNRSTVTREIYVYLTKGEYDGNLGGFTGANQKCEQDRPVDVPAGMTYQAFLGAASYFRTVNGMREKGWNQKPVNVDWNTLVHGVNHGRAGFPFSWCYGCATSMIDVPKVNTVIVNDIHPRYERGVYPYRENDLQHGLAGIFRGARKLSVGQGDGRRGYNPAEGLGLERARFWSWGDSPCSQIAQGWRGVEYLNSCGTAKNIQTPYLIRGSTYARNVFDLRIRTAFSYRPGQNYNACNSWTSNGGGDRAFTGNTARDFSWDSTDWSGISVSDNEQDGEYLNIDGATETRDAIATWSREQTASCAEKHRILCFAQPK